MFKYQEHKLLVILYKMKGEKTIVMGSAENIQNNSLSISVVVEMDLWALHKIDKCSTTAKPPIQNKIS